MNRKVKAIVNAAVAMGYGQLSDYNGNSISEVLAEFAAIAQPSAKLPAAAAADAGKVVSVASAGGYELSAIPAELPAATAADEGKVVSVAAAGGYELSAIPAELPAATAADEGKVVSVDENGDYALAEAGSGDDEFIVNVTLDNDVTVDKTFSEIEAAINEGKIVTYDVRFSGESATDNGRKIVKENRFYGGSYKCEFFAWIGAAGPGTKAVFYKIEIAQNSATVTTYYATVSTSPS